MEIDKAIEEFDFFYEGDYITREMETAKDIVLQELKNTQADLYEANNCISDLLDVAKQREKIIDEILKTWKQDDIRSIEELREYFEERCRNAKD